MADARYSSWPYHRDNYYSKAAALRAEYPETIKRNKQLELALFQIVSAEALIETIMADLASKETE